MFITIPPPFIELPVKMSDVAMYLHECLVLSRKNGKQPEKPKVAQTNGGLAPNGHKLKKGHGSTINLPADGVDPNAAHTTTSGVHVSMPIAVQLNPDAASFNQATLSAVPGLKRLAKAVKTFYPEEYAIGSSKANQAAELAAVEDDHKRKVVSVSNSKKGKSTALGRGGGFLSALQRVRSKSSAAKQTVAGLGTGVAGVRGPGRDTNAERFELVTPWRGE
jgi:hypothetical protein